MVKGEWYTITGRSAKITTENFIGTLDSISSNFVDNHNAEIMFESQYWKWLKLKGKRLLLYIEN